jgi:hypothetical protein
MKAGKTKICALLMAAAVVAALLVLATCSNPVSDLLNAGGWGLLGTWVSSRTIEYAPGMFYKLTVNADGTFRSEDQLGMSVNTGTYTVDSVSVSGNSRTLQVHYVFAGGISHHFVLARVTDGTTYESVYSVTPPYPSMLLATDPNYLAATLQ